MRASRRLLQGDEGLYSGLIDPSLLMLRVESICWSPSLYVLEWEYTRKYRSSDFFYCDLSVAT